MQWPLVIITSATLTWSLVSKKISLLSNLTKRLFTHQGQRVILTTLLKLEMKKTKTSKFSKRTLDFLVKAGKQKSLTWLDKNLEEYEDVLRKPFIALAEKIKAAIKPLAPEYHFPSKGLARIKRPAFKVAGGQSQYKDWISLIASKPSNSRFESNPHLFFGLFPNEDHAVVLAGGLWQPTSRQTRLVREAIRKDAEPFHDLFSDAHFKRSFKQGFFMDETSKRTPRGFPEDHKDLIWIKLKKFVVYKKITVQEFSSAKFNESVIKDFLQALRLNKLLDNALKLNWPPA